MEIPIQTVDKVCEVGKREEKSDNRFSKKTRSTNRSRVVIGVIRVIKVIKVIKIMKITVSTCIFL